MDKQPKLPICDDENYAAMSQPFEDAKQANEALQAFYDEAYELRNKHKLANVTIVVLASIKGSGRFMSNTHFGSSVEAETMAAWHLGMTQAERQDIVRRAMEQGAEFGIKQGKGRK